MRSTHNERGDRGVASLGRRHRPDAPNPIRSPKRGRLSDSRHRPGGDIRVPPVRGDRPPVDVRQNEARDGVEVRFAEKPPFGVRDRLQKAGFRWSRAQALWYARRTPERLAFAEGLREKVTADSDPARSESHETSVPPPLVERPAEPTRGDATEQASSVDPLLARSPPLVYPAATSFARRAGPTP